MIMRKVLGLFIRFLHAGVRDGNTINRIGFSHWKVHDLTQNMMHQQSFFKAGNQHYYLGYEGYHYKGFTNYSGYYNPFSLW